MMRGMRRLLLSRCTALTAILLSAGMIPATTPARTPTTPAPIAQSAPAQDYIGGIASRLEVRLRKLHLVRPDLIPYPLCYEVYC